MGNPKPSKLTNWWSKIRWRAHCLFPRWISHPYSNDEDYFRSRDDERNQETRVRPDRELRCAAIWGVELYGPDEIHSLYASLERLGWNGVGSAKSDNAASTRVRQMRGSGWGGWINLGHVVRSDQKTHSPLVNNSASLPSGVESLIVGVFNITPSTTAVLVTFRLDDTLAGRYEAELNSDRRTMKRRAKGTWAMEWWEPVHQKQDAIAKVREDLRCMAGTWFSRHLPGYFCSTEPARKFPTMELIVGEGMKLSDVDNPSLGGWSNWRRLVAQDIGHEVWTTEEYPGMQLTFEHHRDEEMGLHVLVSLDPKDLPDKAMQGLGDRNLVAYSFLCNQLLGGTLVHSATVEYLRSERRSLHRLRERMKRARSGRKHVTRTLTEIGSFFDETLGSPAILRELSMHSKNLGFYRHACANLTTPAWRDGGEPYQLPKSIRNQVRELSKQLSVEELALRGQIAQLASILSVRESIRAQRWMFTLTIVALAFAAASLIAAIPAKSSIGIALRDFWGATLSAVQHGIR